MALTPQEQERLNKLLQEGIELAKKLGDIASETSLKNFNGDLKAAELMVGSLRSEWEEYINDIKGAREGFTRIVDEIKNINSGTKIAKNAFSGLSSIAAKLQSHQENINTLSSKELKNLKSKVLERVNDLKLASKLTQDQIDSLEGKQTLDSKEIKQLEEARIAQSNINNEIKESVGFIRQLNSQLNDQIKTQEKIEETLGVSGALIKGINKVPFLKDLPGMSSVLKDIEGEIRKINELRKTEGKEPVSRAEALKMTLSKTGGVIKKNITDPFVIFSFLTTQIIDTFTSLDKGIGEFAKGMNLSYQEAANLDQQFNSIANSSGDIAVTTKGIRDTMLAMGQAMGSNATLNAKDAETFTKLREKAGLANEELVEMQKLTLATGGNLEDNVSSMLFAAKTTALNNGVLLNEKQIMKEVAKASAATKLSLAGNPEALAKAAAQAKALGMSLEQVDKIASSLLNIESSISDELEAELLTGKNLNLEQARLYALNNDMEGLSREIAKNFGSAADFSQMNRIQQEAAAKAVGMTREELAATLTDQEALKGLSGKQAEDAKAALAAARERGMSEEEIKKQNIDGLMQQQSVQEKLNNSVEKLKELFVSLVEPLMPVINMLSSILEVVGKVVEFMNEFHLITGALAGLLVGKLFMGFSQVIKAMKTAKKLSMGQAILDIIGNAWKSLGGLPIVGPILAGAAIAGGIALVQKYADDMVSPGYGKRTLMGPEGAIALNDKDTVIAGTNLFDKKADDAISEPGKITEFKPEGAINAPAPTPTSSPSIDYTALASAIVSALSKAPMSVNVKGEIDGKTLVNFIENNATAVGTAQAKGTSKIQ